MDFNSTINIHTKGEKMSKKSMPIEKGHIMMFARAIGDKNSIYYDDDYASQNNKNIIAPPTFTQSSAQFDPDYFLRPKIDEPWFGSGKNPTGLVKSEEKANDESSSNNILHAEQHFEYHQPVCPGDILTPTSIPGEKWEKESKRAGLLKFSESITEYRNEKDELVITARSVGVVTEKTVEN
jgi:acyl dehydratase